MLGKPVGGFTQ